MKKLGFALALILSIYCVNAQNEQKIMDHEVVTKGREVIAMDRI